MLQVLLGVVGLALAWTTFRITHDAAGRRDTASARGLLTAVRAGMVEHRAGPGWGEAFLGDVYTDADAAARVDVVAWGGVLAALVVAAVGCPAEMASTRSPVCSSTVAAR